MTREEDEIAKGPDGPSSDNLTVSEEIRRWQEQRRQDATAAASVSARQRDSSSDDGQNEKKKPPPRIPKEERDQGDLVAVKSLVPAFNKPSATHSASADAEAEAPVAKMVEAMEEGRGHPPATTTATMLLSRAETTYETMKHIFGSGEDASSSEFLCRPGAVAVAEMATTRKSADLGQGAHLIIAGRTSLRVTESGGGSPIGSNDAVSNDPLPSDSLVSDPVVAEQEDIERNDGDDDDDGDDEEEKVLQIEAIKVDESQVYIAERAPENKDETFPIPWYNDQRTYIGISVGILLMALVGGIAGSSISNKNRFQAWPTTTSPSLSPSSVPSSSPTQSPTRCMECIEDQLIRSFGYNESNILFDDDDAAPQRRALEFISKDPQISDYDDERLLTRYALAVLFYTTSTTATTDDGTTEGWINSSEWLSYDEHECDWYGISCSDGDEEGNPGKEDTRRLEAISLKENALKGTIPFEIQALSHLLSLGLHGNKLEGTIPPSIFSTLTNLEVLNLRSNSLVGPIPTTIQTLTNLQELYLYNNDFSGSIPSEVGLLTNLGKINTYMMHRSRL